jgi:hypothetical protein
MNNPKPDADEIGKRLKSAIDYVRDCEARVSRGEIMDLQGLDRNVIEICDAIANLPPKEARDLEDTMSVLIEGLENLAAAMKDQQEKMSSPGVQ